MKIVRLSERKHTTRNKNFVSRMVTRLCSQGQKAKLQSCLGKAYSGSAIARRPVMETISMQKKTGLIERSSMVSRLWAKGVFHQREYSSSFPIACCFCVLYCGSSSSK